VKTLFISGSLDGNTPEANAHLVKKGFTQGLSLLVKYAGHEDMLPNEQVQNLLVDFFNNAQVNITEISMPKPVFNNIHVRSID